MLLAGRSRKLPALLVGLFLLGCKAAPERDYPPDPLLLSRRPTNGDPSVPKPGLLTQAEPLMPPGPPTAVARIPRSPRFPEPHYSSAPHVTGIDYRTIPDANEVLAARHRAAANLGHAADFSWLQGVLEEQPNGQFALRYGPPSIESPDNPIVTLMPDPRLASYRDGDLVFVEGEQVPAVLGFYPGYRIRLIWPVRARP